MQEHNLSIAFRELLTKAAEGLGDILESDNVVDEVYDFMLERLKGIYLDKGVSVNVFEAVASIKPSSIADVDRRIKAVISFEKLPEAESLSAANKRIHNILKKAETAISDQVDPALFEGDEEKSLFDKISAKSQQIEPLMQTFDYEETLISLADLRDAVDHFFDKVMVMAEDEAIRNNRLALLNRLYNLFVGVADISRLQS